MDRHWATANLRVTMIAIMARIIDAKPKDKAMMSLDTAKQSVM